MKTVVISTVIALASAVALAGCTTRLLTEPSGATPTTSTFGYYLPREVYTITVTYQLVACTDPSVAALTAANPPTIKQTATISPTDIADIDQHYYIDFTSMDSTWKNTAFQAALYPNQTLKSVGATIASQAAQVASNLISGGLGIAKLAAGAPSGPVYCKKEVAAALAAQRQVAQDLAAYSPAAPPAKAGDPISAGSPRVKGTDRTADADVATHAVVPTFQKIYVWDPKSLPDSLVIAPDANDLSAWFEGDTAAATDLFPKIVSSTVVVGPARVIPVTSRPTGSPIAGIVYRDPVPAVVRVCATTELAKCDSGMVPSNDNSALVIASQTVSVPQLGAYVVMPLKNSGFDNNNLALAFAANGVPCASAYASQSQLNQISSIFSAFGAGGGGGGSGSSGGGKGGGSTGGGSTGGGNGGGGSGGGNSGGGSGGNQSQNSNNSGAPSVTCSSP
jgi:hypothetical protein